ncbi:MAG: hypothetical protein LBU12_06430 [Deltaproteobacteria bacterium]|nr:hypothetical protein [Deltaproteobacteria bacterium]
MPDFHDCLVQSETESRGLASPFNIKEGTFFPRAEIETVHRQRNEAAGPVFEASAVDQAWRWSKGQPWLVNALAQQIVSRDLMRRPSHWRTPGPGGRDPDLAPRHQHRFSSRAFQGAHGHPSHGGCFCRH